MLWLCCKCKCEFLWCWWTCVKFNNITQITHFGVMKFTVLWPWTIYNVPLRYKMISGWVQVVLQDKQIFFPCSKIFEFFRNLVKSNVRKKNAFAKCVFLLNFTTFQTLQNVCFNTIKACYTSQNHFFINKVTHCTVTALQNKCYILIGKG